MAKRLHYICNPHLPVATRKRIWYPNLHLYFFDLKSLEFICESKAALALRSSEFSSGICVPLPAAKLLADKSLRYVYALDVTHANILDHEAFCLSVRAQLDSSINSIWYPPAGFDRGRVDMII